MHLEEIILWAAGIVAAVVGWFINDRVSSMDTRMSTMEEAMTKLEDDMDTKVNKEDLKDLLKPLRDDMTYIRQRVDQAVDRRQSSRE